MTDTVRIDKWLWAARFFKTRSLATEAVSGGKVHLNGERTKPAKGIKIGDQLVIHKLETEFIVNILGLSEKRGPAKVAQTLYEETVDSISVREEQREARRLKLQQNPAPSRRPDKRARRQIHRFKNIRDV